MNNVTAKNAKKVTKETVLKYCTVTLSDHNNNSPKRPVTKRNKKLLERTDSASLPINRTCSLIVELNTDHSGS